MFGQHHRFNGHEFEQAPGIGEGQGSLSEKAMAPHSSTLAWKIPWMEEPGRLHPWGCKESDMTEATQYAHTAEYIVQLLSHV